MGGALRGMYDSMGALRVVSMDEWIGNFGLVGALQKQVGCFNYRVVTMVADKLERQWL